MQSNAVKLAIVVVVVVLLLLLPLNARINFSKVICRYSAKLTELSDGGLPPVLVTFSPSQTFTTYSHSCSNIIIQSAAR